MKRVAIPLAAALLLTGCGPPSDTIAFKAAILEVRQDSLLVETADDVGFDRAVVGFEAGWPPDFEPAAGQAVKIEIKPDIRESYPVQVTAVAITLLEEETEVPLKPTYTTITAQEAKKMIDGGGAVILDVRTRAEFDAGHIEGAILLPDDEIEARAFERLHDKEAVLLVYCRSGRRSATAARLLAEMGYTAVYDFGGILDWPYETVAGA